MKQGFTLIEVMISLAIIGLVLTALSGLQIGLMRTAVQSSERLKRIREVVAFFNEARVKEPETGKKVISENKELNLKLTYEHKRPPKESSLFKLKDLMIERVSAQWEGRGPKARARTSMQDRFVTFIYKPELKDETRDKPA